ncbi:gamma-tubulin complex component 3 homolog [Acropora millepora]|uniref:gamma-tubulin complex component 3 homolog n=1 Tax=Acropora millepora TaxID=45264 RepID=UPI001CF5C12A|nr:gamma-tubulin complex component 3 homolog [Acropora millepora]
MASQEESSRSDSSSPEALLYKLCRRLLGKETDSKDKSIEISNHFQYAVKLLGSHFAPTVATDEFRVVERIKRKLLKEKGEVEIAIFAELYRKLVSQPVLKNRWAILYFLMSVGEDSSSKHSHGQGSCGGPSFFGRGLPTYLTSTPAVPGEASNRPSSHTPGILSMTHATESSSGISSVATRSSNPTPIPPSFVPNYGPTPSVHFADEVMTHEANDGSRLASLVAQSLSISQSRGRNTGTASQSIGATPVVRYMSFGNDSQNTSHEVSEAILLREIIYIFQGIEGKIIKLDQSNDAYRIDSKLGVPRSVRDLVNKLAELGWLYRKIRKYLDAHAGDKAMGLVGQSFCAALQQELTEYYRLLAVLEGQQQLGDAGFVGEGASGSLTLRRLMVWTFDPLTRLQTLAALVDACKGKKGGALLSALYSNMQHGDPFVKSLVRHILNLVSRPIRLILDRWIYEGELDDLYNEFFVAVDYDTKDDRLWYEKYSIRKPMLPSFISFELGTKILNIGKTINFIRRVCEDRSPIRGGEEKALDSIRSQEGSATAQLTAEEEFGGVALQETIDTAYRITSKRLLEIFFTKYKFVDHLRALRLYLLLGQGDFIRHLMDLLESDLAKAASTLYMHNLTGVLETAIRATNAQYADPEIIERLDCRLLEVSPGDTGWDVFSLDYHVDGPISTVFTPECMIHYLRIFNFLWRAKRMEYCLTEMWKQQMTTRRMLKSLPEVSPILHMCHMLGTEMIHFVHQMQYYITFEVLECCWADLKKQVAEASDLDHIIAAHETFLDQVLNRCLLDAESRKMLTQLRAIFDLIIQFQNAQESFFSAATRELQSRQALEKAIETRADEGKWGMTDKDEELERKRSVKFVDNVIPDTRAQLKVLSKSYQDMVQQFLMMLTSHHDVSLRFLSFRLDFNEHYKKIEPKLRSPLTHRFSKRIKTPVPKAHLKQASDPSDQTQS